MPEPKLQAVERPDLPPRPISQRLRQQLAYFAKLPNAADSLTLGESEYFFPRAEIASTLDDGVILLVSPLDTANMTEVELSEEQEALLEWLKQNNVEHVRVLE